MRGRQRALSGRLSRVAIGVAAALLLGVLVAFAIVLINQQRGDRNDIKDNFRDRATVSAALTQSLFEASSTASQTENARRFGTRDVPSQELAQQAQQGQSPYIVLLDPKGKVISSSPGTPAEVTKRLEQIPQDVKTVLDGATYSLSNFLNFPAAKLSTFEYSAAIPTNFGRRVLVSGVSPQLLATFLAGYLSKVPNVEGGSAYLLDGNGNSIAATDAAVASGTPPKTAGLLDAVNNGDQGSFGDGQYFVEAPVQGSPWKVVSTAPESTLFASVTGAHKWVPWMIFGLFAAAGVFALALLARVLRNAAELADANTALEDANVALEQRAQELSRSNAELEQFASIASHDLKEPLRKVQTFTEQLASKESERLSDEGRDYLERTGAAGQRMQALIDDLLRFSRVATQGRPFEQVDLGEVARQAVSDLEGVTAQSGGSIEVGELPTVAADPLQMRQLVQNLISNALKFRREGVPPEVRITGSTTRGRFAEIKVADNGIGFEQRYQARIFRVFERLHGRGSYPGTGIGLALCRKIVDRHGGTITAESTPGKGSTFTVTLPLAQPAEALEALGTNGDGRRAESPRVHA
ncbi:MAG: ATP-binding protein [Solirubrobacterales bacterium]